MTIPRGTTAVVRMAADADIPALSDLNTGLFAEDAGTRDAFVNLEWSGRAQYFADLIADGRRNIALVADIDGSPAGYVVARLHDASDFRPVVTAVLESMYVRPDHRNSGVGTALVRSFLEWAKGAESGRVVVTAYVENAGAIRFYERFGLRPRAVTLGMAV